MDYPVCPKCGHYIPNDETPGAYPGALSREDNKTEICSDCGTKEAIESLRRVLYLREPGDPPELADMS